MARTETAKYVFTVKEGAPGEAGEHAPTFLMCEPAELDLNILGHNKFLTIELAPGTTAVRAREIADILNESASGIGVTTI